MLLLHCVVQGLVDQRLRVQREIMVQEVVGRTQLEFQVMYSRLYNDLCLLPFFKRISEPVFPDVIPLKLPDPRLQLLYLILNLLGPRIASI